MKKKKVNANEQIEKELQEQAESRKAQIKPIDIDKLYQEIKKDYGTTLENLGNE